MRYFRTITFKDGTQFTIEVNKQQFEKWKENLSHMLAEGIGYLHINALEDNLVTYSINMEDVRMIEHWTESEKKETSSG